MAIRTDQTFLGLKINQKGTYLTEKLSVSIYSRLVLDSTYSFLLDNQRLQIYQGTKTRTFISFNINDANDLSVVSVDLNRFDPRLSTRLGGIRVRKEAFVEIEGYCLDPNGHPISKIHLAEPPISLARREEFDVTSEETFHSVEEDFPNLGDDYSGIYLKAQKEMTRLHSLHDTSSLTIDAFTMFSDLLEKMDDPLVSKMILSTNFVLLSCYYLKLFRVLELPSQILQRVFALYQCRVCSS